MTNQFALSPRLIVSDPDTAMKFYQRVFDARQLERFTDNRNRVVHLGFSIGNALLSMAQSVPDWGLLDPLALGGSPCLLHLSVDDPDQLASQFETHGGKIVISIADRPYGKREGRVQDPAGHLWILSKSIEELEAEEIGRRLKSS